MRASVFQRGIGKWIAVSLGSRRLKVLDLGGGASIRVKVVDANRLVELSLARDGSVTAAEDSCEIQELSSCVRTWTRPNSMGCYPG
jgi:hypothetical protein